MPLRRYKSAAQSSHIDSAPRQAASSHEQPRGGEDDLIDWLKHRSKDRGGRWIGDDAAILPRSDHWAVTMDTQIEGVHFLPGLDAATLARRLLAVNLSDLAAMGASPGYAFLALSAPVGFDHRLFFEAFLEAAEQYDLELAGGDLSRQEKTMTVLTLLGSKPEGSRWIRRDSANAGDDLWLGGTIGESATGLQLLLRGAQWNGDSILIPDVIQLPPDLLGIADQAIRRHLVPEAQMELGHWLGRRPSAAAIDVSDGLARDLERLCKRSGVGAEIELSRLPLAPGLDALIHALDGNWQELVLGGGEDYVLLFTLPAGTEVPTRFGCAKIGTITEQDIVISSRGSKHPLASIGWDHLATPEAIDQRNAKGPARSGTSRGYQR